MNKKELAEKVTEKTGLTKKDAEAAINATFEAVTEALKEGDSVQLFGFGTFEISERAARQGFNPLTKEKIQIEASKAPKFKPAKALKDAVK